MRERGEGKCQNTVSAGFQSQEQGVTHPPAALCYCRGDERRQLARYYSAEAKCVAEFQSPESQNERWGNIEEMHNDITKCICFRKSFGGWWEARWQSGNARLSGSQESRFESGPVPKLIRAPASRADWGDIFYKYFIFFLISCR